MKKLIIGIALALVLAATTVPIVAANGQDPLDYVVISPDPGVVAPGGNLQFTAISKDAEDDIVVGVIYSWQVVAGGGTINSNGLFTAGIAVGTFTDTVKVTASKGGLTRIDYATVRVANPGVLDSVAISPDPATLQPANTQQFSAQGKDAFGQAVAGVTYFWEVLAGGGTIDNATGLFTADAATGTFADTVRVTAIQTSTSTSRYDTATVKVAIPGILDSVVISPDSATVLVGGTKQFNATAKDAYANTLTGITFSWMKVSGVGAIDINTGLFSAGSEPGNATIRVTAIQGSVSVIDDATVSVTTQPAGKDFRVPAGWSHGKKTGWNGGDTPPGWSKGKKIGWNDEGVPPGLLKQVDQDDENDEDDDDEDDDEPRGWLNGKKTGWPHDNDEDDDDDD